jgi:hypothetical protein
MQAIVLPIIATNSADCDFLWPVPDPPADWVEVQAENTTNNGYSVALSSDNTEDLIVTPNHTTPEQVLGVPKDINQSFTLKVSTYPGGKVVHTESFTSQGIVSQVAGATIIKECKLMVKIFQSTGKQVVVFVFVEAK